MTSRRAFLAGAAILLTTQSVANTHSAIAAESPSGKLRLDQGFEDFVAYFRMISDFGGGTTYRYHYGRTLIVPAPRQLAEDFVDFVVMPDVN